MNEFQYISILLFEDDEEDYFLLEQYLSESKSFHFHIDRVKKINEGLARLSEKSYDVILLDLGLPGSSGLETFNKLIDRVGKTPVLILTGLNDDELALEAVKRGAQDYLVKYDISNNVLIKSIRYAIERSNMVNKLVQYTAELKEKQRFEQISEIVTDGIIICNEAGDILFMNSAAKTIVEQGESFDLNSLFKAKNKDLEIEILGAIHTYEVNFSSMAWDNELTANLIYFRDITERKRMENNIRMNENKYRSLFENLSDAFLYGKMLFSENHQLIDSVILEVNPKYESFFNVKNEQVVNRSFTASFPLCDNWCCPKFMADIAFTHKDSRTIYFSEKQNKWYSILAYYINDDYFACVISDITAQKTSQMELEYFGSHDSLTDLFNRAYFEKEKEQLEIIGTAPLTFIIFDINGLKTINDTLGHDFGDKLLRITGQLIEQSFGNTGKVYRIGGDEFLAVVPADEPEVTALVEKFHHNIEDYNQKQEFYLSISLGYSTRLSKNKPLEELYKEADNNMYHQKIFSKESTKSAIVKTLSYALLSRDFRTNDHADRIKADIMKFARELGYNENKMMDLQLLAQFHDIGKVAIPDQILFKPGKLTEDEMKIMRTHVTIGYRIAQSSPELEHIAPGILMHHEQWDGKGYPNGIKGEDIPLECRILALIDSYDAMTNDRPYRKALSHEAAIMEIKRCAGTQFDPKLAQIFINLF